VGKHIVTTQTQASQCAFIRPDGSRCGANLVHDGSGMCFWHSNAPVTVAVRTAARIRGGRNQKRQQKRQAERAMLTGPVRLEQPTDVFVPDRARTGEVLCWSRRWRGQGSRTPDGSRVEGATIDQPRAGS